MKGNLLDFIPAKNIDYKCENNVILLRENKGIFNRLFQKFLKKPEFTEISLDEYGTVVWNLIDGKKTIYDIYNETSEITSLAQLVKFFSILFKHKFIIYVT